MSNEQICLNCMQDMKEFDICMNCGWVKGTQAEDPFQLSPGVMLNGRYLVGMVISMGGFGILYHGFDTVLKSHIAIKEFYPSGLVNRSPGIKELYVFSGAKKEQYKKMLTRFVEEGRTMAKFSSSKNVVNVLDYFEENKTAYIVMEYLDGCSLREYLKNHQYLSVEETVELITPVMDALIAVHKENIIHRDVNPNNIFLTEKLVKLIDFGSARLSLEDTVEEYTVVITPGYAPFEQYNQKSKQGQYTDVYAVAATMYRMLTGIVPEESSDRMKDDQLMSLQSLNPSVTKEVENIVLRGMATEAKLRFKTMQEFKDALLANKLVKVPKEVARIRRFRRIGLALMSVALLIGAVWYYNYSANNNAVLALDSSELIDQTVQVAVPSGEVDFDESVFNQIEANFEEQYPEIDVEINYIPVEEYEASVLSGNYDVYRNDLAEGAKKTDMQKVYDSLDYSNYEALETNKDMFIENQVVPTGFNVPILYVNKYLSQTIAEIDPSKMTFEEYAQLEGAYADLASFEHLYVSDEAYVNLVMNQQTEEIAAESIESRIDELNNLAGAVDGNDAITKLAENQLLSYMGSSKDYYSVQDVAGGNYLLQQPFMSESLQGEVIHTWAIQPSNEDQELSSMIFVAYLLTDYSQNFIYVQNNVGLPLNETTLSNNYIEFSFLKEMMRNIYFSEIE